MPVASTHTQSRSASTHSVQSHQCWLGLVLCQIRCRDEPFAKKSLTLRLPGCAVAAVGVEGMVIIDDLIAIGIRIHLYFPWQCGGGRGFACAQTWPPLLFTGTGKPTARSGHKRRCR